MGLFASALLVVVTLVAAAIPSITLPGTGTGEEPLFPAPPGYLLPWAGGEIHSITQGEETSFTHNGLAAYAFDIDLNYDTIVAARSGRVTMVYDGSNRGGCDPALSVASNYVVIDHGDGTSGLYLHLAYAATMVKPGDLVERGQPLALSGETGVTCADDGGPAPHLHFQVQSTEEGRYFTQSLPLAFDDIGENSGVPLEGESYVSGNYGRGKPQKIRLTAHRAQRLFAPKATPADPGLTELRPMPTETPAAAETAIDAATETVTATPTSTPVPDDTATPEPADTPAPTDTSVPSSTAAPADPPTPVVSDTPVAAQSDTPIPAPSDTPVLAETAPPPPAETTAAQ